MVKWFVWNHLLQASTWIFILGHHCSIRYQIPSPKIVLYHLRSVTPQLLNGIRLTWLLSEGLSTKAIHFLLAKFLKLRDINLTKLHPWEACSIIETIIEILYHERYINIVSISQNSKFLKVPIPIELIDFIFLFGNIYTKASKTRPGIQSSQICWPTGLRGYQARLRFLYRENWILFWGKNNLKDKSNRFVLKGVFNCYTSMQQTKLVGRPRAKIVHFFDKKRENWHRCSLKDGEYFRAALNLIRSVNIGKYLDIMTSTTFVKTIN